MESFIITRRTEAKEVKERLHMEAVGTNLTTNRIKIHTHDIQVAAVIGLIPDIIVDDTLISLYLLFTNLIKLINWAILYEIYCKFSLLLNPIRYKLCFKLNSRTHNKILQFVVGVPRGSVLRDYVYILVFAYYNKIN